MDELAGQAVVMQHKTERPVQFEITQVSREAVQNWIFAKVVRTATS
jgi:hypothetical protein